MTIIREPSDTKKRNFCIASNYKFVPYIIIIIIIILFRGITFYVMTDSDLVKFHDTRMNLKVNKGKGKGVP